MSTLARKPYSSDLSDAQWEILEPLIPPPAAGGRPRTLDMREVVNTILYLNRTGCQWDMLPHDLLPKSSVYDYFAAWRDNGVWQQMVDALRCQVRAQEGRDATPSAASIDSQSVKTTERGGERGYDGAKKLTGRKRHLLVDVLGLLIAVVVTSAALDDAAAAPSVLEQISDENCPRLTKIWADGKYHNHQLAAWMKQHHPNVDLEVVSRPVGAKGFVLLHRRSRGGANQCLERPLAPAQQGLRAAHRFQRIDDSSTRASTDAETTRASQSHATVPLHSRRLNRRLFRGFLSG